MFLRTVFFSKMHSIHNLFLDTEQKLIRIFIYYLCILLGTITESMRNHFRYMPEKLEGPYFGIYLFEMYPHIFLRIILKVLKKLYLFVPQLYHIKKDVSSHS